ncbi:MAG: hypothetical protein MZV64_16515 [Ignavibacteriales bacterium]|nr:hypothetical protein [Ignavibacteriales bacterium]
MLIQSKGDSPMEFHVSRAARERYQFDQLLFSTNGNVILPTFLLPGNLLNR